MGRILSAFIIVVILFTLNACWTCNEEVCPAGFHLKIMDGSNASLAPGSYRFNIGLEEHQFEVNCIIEEDLQLSSCTEVNTLPEGWHVWLIPVRENTVETAEPDETASPDGFDFSAEYSIGGDYPDNSVRGPETVSIVIHFEGNHLATQEYQPTYQRDKDYWGDEECGYCDRQVSETLMIDTTDVPAVGN